MNTASFKSMVRAVRGRLFEIGFVTIGAWLVVAAQEPGGAGTNAPAPPAVRTVVRLDGRSPGRTFEGLGALSAGASSRLLIDYPEPQRSQVLDFLFKPKFGAGFQHLKVEVGGDVNSTDGCEPSHMRTRGDLNFQRGYEWWLMKEAKRRNPGVMLDMLQWGAPAWIGRGHFYSQDNADFLVKFIQGARRVHGLEIDYAGGWNETRYDTGWLKLFRRTLDREGLGRVQIVAADEIDRWSVAELIALDPELDLAVDVVGTHYPKYRSSAAAVRTGKRLWASEDGPWKGTWEGAVALAKLYNRNYLEGRMTKTIVWSPVTAYYDNLPLPGSGVMKANTPWSGAYEVQPALWATAHTTQFAEPGWLYLDGGCGWLGAGAHGSYVALRAPRDGDYSVIVETLDAKVPQILVFELAGGLAEKPVQVWRSDAAEQFVRVGDMVPVHGRFEVRLDGGCIYSLTTTTGQTKGVYAVPAARPFPLPYLEDFERYAPGTTPAYFSDQAGIFEVVQRGRRGRALRQVILAKGIEWHLHWNPFPETFLGDPGWTDYEVSVEARLEGEGFVSLFGRVGKVPQSKELPEGYWLKVASSGAWELGTDKHPLASGRAAIRPRAWHHLALRFEGRTVRVTIDGRWVGEVSHEQYAAGMVGLGSGFHGAQFDNLRVLPVPR